MNVNAMVLSKGAHATPSDGVCLLEAAAWVAGEPHTDHPVCVSPMLATFGRELTDALLPARADLEPRLRALVPRLVGTAGHPEEDQRVNLMAADWLIRVYAPTWFRLAGLDQYAAALAGSVPIESWDAVPTANLLAAGKAAAAARAAAWIDARNAASSGVWYVVCVAAWNEAWDDAWYVTRAAVWDAAWVAAKNAASGSLQPTVAELQDLAMSLFEQMVGIYPEASR